MSKFTQREKHNAKLAARGHEMFRHTNDQSMALLRELAQFLPVEFLGALLDVKSTVINKALRTGIIAAQHQRVIYYLHMMSFHRYEETLFNVACWGGLPEKQVLDLKRFSDQHSAVLGVFVEMEGIRPEKVLGIMRNRLPKIAQERIEAIVEELMVGEQIYANPLDGRWCVDKRVGIAYKAAIAYRKKQIADRHEAKSDTFMALPQPVS